MTTIYTALAAVMKDCDHVAKRDRNEQQRFNFRGIDAVVNAVGPVLRTHGVIVAPNVERVDYESVESKSGNRGTACRILATYTFYGPDGTSIDCRVAGEAMDWGDKATPKAMSVCFRTALLQALALPTDDPDADSQNYEAAPERRAERMRTTPTDDPFYQAPPTVRETGELMSAKTRGQMFAEFGRTGVAEADQLPGINHICGTAYTSRSQLTEADAKKVIAVLKKRPDAPKPEPEEAPK
jgi:hypothetical protein